MSLEGDIVTALANASLGTDGTNLFRGPMRDGQGFPDAMITALETGGARPDRYGREGLAAKARPGPRPQREERLRDRANDGIGCLHRPA